MRLHVLASASFAIFIGLSPLFGQGVTLVGSGYSNPTSIRVSPGQITTLFVSGLNLDAAKSQTATTLSLPISLAGISVAMKQSQSYDAPILAVQQLAVCPAGGSGGGAKPITPPDCLVGAITLQVPYELSPIPLPNGGGTAFADVVVSQNGIPSETFPIFVTPDNLHVLTNCDEFPSKQSGTQILVNGGCNSVVTHADGTLVTADSPALPGETVVIYAFGLGQTNPTPKTGQASPTPASSFLYLQFDFRTNASPSRPYVNPLIMAPIPTPGPVFAGLTPGQVGLYQINVTIPSTIPAVDKCGSTCSHVACTTYNTVTSNLTIDIGANLSWDGAAICVQPPQ